jgi:hypothetical protein
MNKEPDETLCTDKSELAFCNCYKCTAMIYILYNTTQYLTENLIQLRQIYKEHKMTFARFAQYLTHTYKREITQIGLLPLFFNYFNTDTGNILSFPNFIDAVAILNGTSRRITTERLFFDILSVNGKMTKDTVAEIFYGNNELSVQLSKLITSYIIRWDTNNVGYITWTDIINNMHTMNSINQRIVFSLFRDYRIDYRTYTKI